MKGSKVNSSTNGFDFRELADDIKSLVTKYSSASSSKTQFVKPTSEQISNAVLSALQSGDKTAREIMTTVAGFTSGSWVPAESDVYPVLEKLVTDGLISSTVDGELKCYSLTKAGKKVAGAVKEDLSTMFATNQQQSQNWSPNCRADVLKSGAKLAQAVTAVANSGSSEQQKRAEQILDDARRKLFAILAED